MRKTLFFNLWKFWSCAGWFSGEDFRLFHIEIKIYEAELDYLFLFSFQITKFCIAFGIDL